MGSLALLQLLVVFHSSDAITRTFYIAAVERLWNYKDGTMFPMGQRDNTRSAGSAIHKKAIYMEYSDASFMEPKPREPSRGLLGPLIRLETFDSAVIHFKNLASVPYSLHGVGVSYAKRSEGAGYEDGTSDPEKVDDAIPPGQEYIYTWNIPEGYGPVESDPPCITSAYYSHSNTSYDTNSGLVGVLLICKPGSLSEDGSQYGAQENIIALAVFDERLSHYNDGLEDSPLHTINGFINGSIPEQAMCAKKPSYFHVVGLGTHVEVHRFSLEGHSFVIGEHRVPILPVTAFSFFTAVVNPGEKGVYKLSCQTRTHPEGRMTSLVRVEECIRDPETRSNVHDEEDYDYEDEYFDSPVYHMADEAEAVNPRSHSKRSPVTWTHYIAAVEVDWDYQPTSNDKRYRFTKVLYREFTNAKFTHRKLSEIPGTGILGPVLRGEVGDQIQIVFKNLARHPYNIYPQGLSSVSSDRPSLAGEQLKDYPIHPNDSITYTWQVTTHDSPASSDPRCLTRFYASFLNLQKDLASGLMGPLLICSKQTLDRAGNQIVTDKENILFFCIFDETLSWYHEENNEKSAITLSADKSAIVKPPGGNLIYTINGIVESLQLSICQNEVSVWHVLNLGLGTKLLSIYFGGNTFMVDSGYQETLTLIPMNGKTVVMVMEKTGQWPVAPDSPLADLGMNATLRVSHCELHPDDYYEYEHEDFKEISHDPDLDPFPFITSLQSPPSAPRSVSKKSQTPDYRPPDLSDHAILNDEPANVLQPIGSTKNQNGADKGEPAKGLRRQQRDTRGQTNKTLESGSGVNKSEGGDNVDFYDDEYNSADSEYIDMYGEVDPRSHQGQLHTYFIAAVEVTWDYGGGRSPYFIKARHQAVHGFPSYKKVVFREYLDSSFTEPATRGERDAHLGLLGPCIRAEVNDEIIIQFKNMASRPYSFFSNVLAVQWKEEASVPPQQTRTYTGKVSAQFGPTGSEECRTWFYTSNGHMYKDFHSGLIGPLLVCRPNVLKRSIVHQISMEDFSLVFMEMDEMKSWYFTENRQKRCPSICAFQPNVLPSCPPACTSPSATDDGPHDHTFHAINGYVGDSLPGLVLPLDRKIRWHLLNIGRRDILPVQFHGNILKQGSQKDHPCSIVNLYPGVGVTLEMTAQTTGVWRIEPEGVYNDYNMTALYLVYNLRCHQPLGLSSGKIKDSQITASGHYGSWLPYLARLGNSGAINAWSVENENSWIQVDLLTPMLIHAIQTQGARQRLSSLFISQYIVFYSINGEQWNQYQGNTSSNQMVFFGNVDASSIRENQFNPPIIARFVRIRPVHTGTRAGLRMELFGCDLTSCSMSLGMQSGAIMPYQLSASSSLYSVFSSWLPNLARLNLQGRINAWRPQTDRPGEWFQVDLGREMKVTGLMIQGARSFTAMYITEFSLSASSDGVRWTDVKSLNGIRQTFVGNADSDTPMWVTMEAPVIARFLKLHPEKWKRSIALRMEVLGCIV